MKAFSFLLLLEMFELNIKFVCWCNVKNIAYKYRSERPEERPTYVLYKVFLQDHSLIVLHKAYLISLYTNIIKDGKAGNKTEYYRPVVAGMQLGIRS